MKLLRVIHSMNPRVGGPVEAILQITPHLARLGVETTIVTLDQPSSPWLSSPPCQVLALGPAFSGYGFKLSMVKTMRSLAVGYDTVFIHGIWQYHSLATWLALRCSDVPYYVYLHGMLDPWFNSNYPAKYLKKYFYWLLFERHVISCSKAVLFTTERERELASFSFPFYSAKDIVVGYGTSSPDGDIEQQCSAFYQSYPGLSGKRLLLFMGRIHPKKGIDLLIKAFAQLSDYDPLLHLVIAGPDQIGWQEQLVNDSRRLNVSHRITWTGMLTGTLKWGAYRSAELFCLPSHQENFGVAISESLACGLPVMVTHAVNISPYIQDAQAGIVHPDTLSGTLSALRSWHSLPASQHILMRTNARALFESHFNLSSIASNLLPLIRPNLSTINA